MQVLWIYDHPHDPLTSLAINMRETLSPHITILSVLEFIDHVCINDQMDSDGVLIKWTFEKDGQTKTWTNRDTYLVNRCFHLHAVCNTAFHPDDRDYAASELTAYFRFAFNAFADRLQSVDYYGISGPEMPLMAQWYQLKDKIPGLATPEFYIGPARNTPWTRSIYNQDPYNVMQWVETDLPAEAQASYQFSYLKPKGTPIVVFVTPFAADIVKDERNIEDGSQDEFLKEYALKAAHHLNIQVGEVLLFAANEGVTFGCATPRIIRAQNAPRFKELILEVIRRRPKFQNQKELSLLATTANTRAACSLAIGLEADRTLQALISSSVFAEHGVFFSLEDAGKNWDFRFTEKGLEFWRDEEKLEGITSIYYRPPAMNYNEMKGEAAWLLHLALDLTDTLVFGRAKLQHANSSKPLQTLQLGQLFRSKAVTFPKTLILKGHEGSLPCLPQAPSITKSISSMRSIVVNQETYSHWSQDGLRSLPALFQSEIKGYDVRVHLCQGKAFAMRVREKNSVDYRYADTSDFEPMELPPEVIEFCHDVARLEENPLMGIDFFETDAGYVFLEANPMPGWDWFFPATGQREELCRAIITAS